MKTEDKKNLESLMKSVAREHGVKADDIIIGGRIGNLPAARREFFARSYYDLCLLPSDVAHLYGWTSQAIYYHVKKWREGSKALKKAA